MSKLSELTSLGQSIWLDFISRDLLDSGYLAKLIKEYNISGLTSNPSIFEKAISNNNYYKEKIKLLSDSGINNKKNIYEKLVIKDIQDAADILSPIYDKTNKKDGYVSLEVSPLLAFDRLASIEEAKFLWQEVNRPNLMIKIPGTKQGISSIEELIYLGLNINVTLLFHVDYYEQAALAYIAGIKKRQEEGLAVGNIHSVASFFVSRIDTKIDNILEKIIINSNKKHKILAESLLGKIAINNAKMAYSKFLDIYSKHDIHPQRLLWASTGTKNNKYSDVLYIDNLIAKDTVNTLPLASLEAFKDHGRASNYFLEDLSQAPKIINILRELDIDFNILCEDLLTEGVDIFNRSFDELLNMIDKKS